MSRSDRKYGCLSADMIGRGIGRAARPERHHDGRGTEVAGSRLWYGMPSYALDGKVVCFFQSAEKFKARYATLGFSDLAQLDDGPMWASAFALTEVTPGVEKRIAGLVARAVN